MKPWLAACLVWLYTAAAAAPAAPLSPAPFLWEIRHGGTSHYLLGSVHLLPKAAHPLPPRLEQAYTEADAIFFESDLGALDEPKMQKAMLAAARRQDARAEIGDKTLARVQAIARAHGLPPELCDPYAAWFCAMTLELLSFRDQGFEAAHGLDQHFYRRALGDNKTIRWFESPSVHLQLFTSMDDALGAEMLRSALDDYDKPDNQPAALFRAWQSGDETFVEELTETVRRDYPKVHAALLADRNKAWLPILSARLQKHETQLFVVGAAHLYGPDGLISLLRAQGFDIAPVAEPATSSPAPAPH